MKLCFLHGLDSSPQGAKASFLKAYDPSCLIPNLPPDLMLQAMGQIKALVLNRERQIFPG